MELTTLSQDLKDALECAGFEAAELKHQMREPGHLLIAILVLPETPAKKALLAYGVTLERLRAAVAKRYQWDSDQSDRFIDVASIDAEKVLAITEQFTTKATMTKIDHLLIVLSQEDEVVALIFEDMHVNPKKLLDRHKHEIAGSKN